MAGPLPPLDPPLLIVQSYLDTLLHYVWDLSSVGAVRKVSPNWSQETMTCHSSNCFSIVWGHGNEPQLFRAAAT